MKINIIFFFLTNIVTCAFIITTTFQPISATLALAFAFVNASLIFLTMNFEFIALIFLIVYVGAIIILFLFSILLLHLKNERSIENSLDVNYKASICFFLVNYIILFFYFNNSDFISFEDSIVRNFCYGSMLFLSPKVIVEIKEVVYDSYFDFIIWCLTNKVFSFLYHPRWKPLWYEIQWMEGKFDIKPSPYYDNLDCSDSLYSEIESIGLLLYTDGCIYLILVSLILLVALIGSVVLINPNSSNLIESQNQINQISKKQNIIFLD
jgi:NADH:ubiquinone oxidoreductase subunit 6 (subunit J)